MNLYLPPLEDLDIPVSSGNGCGDVYHSSSGGSDEEPRQVHIQEQPQNDGGGTTRRRSTAEPPVLVGVKLPKRRRLEDHLYDHHHNHILSHGLSFNKEDEPRQPQEDHQDERSS